MPYARVRLRFGDSEVDSPAPATPTRLARSFPHRARRALGPGTGLAFLSHDTGLPRIAGAVAPPMPPPHRREGREGVLGHDAIPRPKRTNPLLYPPPARRGRRYGVPRQRRRCEVQENRGSWLCFGESRLRTTEHPLCLPLTEGEGREGVRSPGRHTVRRDEKAQANRGSWLCFGESRLDPGRHIRSRFRANPMKTNTDLASFVPSTGEALIPNDSLASFGKKNHAVD